MKKKAVLCCFVFALVSAAVPAQRKALPPLEELAGNTPGWLDEVPPDNALWGIGAGKLSTIEAGSALAESSALADIVRQVYGIPNFISSDDKKFEAYHNMFWYLVNLQMSGQAKYELYPVMQVEKRARQKDGTVWCRVSVPKADIEKLMPVIRAHMDGIWNEWKEEIDHYAN